MNPQNLPLISVCVINYNGAQYLGDSIRSILEQTYPNIEIVFCDDASTDDSIHVFEGLISSSHRPVKVTLVRHPTNLGVERNMLDGLQSFNGQYVCNVDSDDALLPNHIETLYRLITESGCDIACTNHWEFTDSPPREPGGTEVASFNHYQTYTAEHAIQTFFLGDQVVPFAYWHRLYKRSCSRRVSQLPWSLFLNSDSAFSVSQFCEARMIAYADVKTYLYRVREDSLSHSSSYLYIKNKTYRSLDPIVQHYGQSFPEIDRLNAHRNDVALANALDACIREQFGIREFRRCCQHLSSREDRRNIAPFLSIHSPRLTRKFVRMLFPIAPSLLYGYERTVATIDGMTRVFRKGIHGSRS